MKSQYKISILLTLPVLVLLLCATTAFARDLSVRVDPALAAAGISADTASTEGKQAVVFTTFNLPFHGEIYLRGLASDGSEIARSNHMTVSKAKEEGGNLTFQFDAQTDLGDVRSFVIEGRIIPPPPPEKPTVIEELLDI